MFNRTLMLQMRWCRYLIYGALLSIHIAFLYETQSFISDWLMALFVLPACAHLGLQFGRNPAFYLHVIEVLLLPTVLLLAGSPVELIGIALTSTLVCNALLWGGYSLPVVVGLAGIGMMVSLDLSYLPSLAHVSYLPATGYTYVVLLVLATATIAQRRAQALAVKDARLRKQNLLLRRYLPEDMWREANETRRTQRAWTTVVFIDLCGFTTAIERLSPELVEELLNDFLTAVTLPIQDQHGSVHKFLGDGVLCVFRAPESPQRLAYARQGLMAVKAVGAAIHHLNKDWRSKGLPDDFDVSVGLASGYCTLGDWGSTARLDFTVIGSAVNRASRLQEKAPAGEIYLDETTAQLLGEAECAFVRSSSLKGIGSINIYAPLPG